MECISLSKEEEDNMKILWLYRYTPHRHYNHWLHTDFAFNLARQEEVVLRFYGWKMHERSDFSPLLYCPYNSEMTLEDIRKEFKFDIIILDCYNRAYKTVKLRTLWLPSDFKTIQVPKICIEGDYHNQKNPNWYVDFGFNLMLHRHYANVLRARKQLPIRNHWLPCSIDNTIFKPNPDNERLNKFCFVGESNGRAYQYRNRALSLLMKKGLIKKEPLLREELYLQCLQNYTSYLSGSSIYDLDIAKSFEIMASGGVLLTNETEDSGMQMLFGDNSYCTYKKDCSDLSIKANLILNDKDYREMLVTNALNCINTKHTHTIRSHELLRIIKRIF